MPVFDIETDGLNSTKIHVLSWADDNGDVQHTYDYEAMRIFFTEAKVLIGHNIVRFDIPAVEKVLGIEVKATLIDTLALSWYINHHRSKHGLESYGEDYGVPKPKISDWENLTKEEYAHRCNEDVKINMRLWRDLEIKLNKLYCDKPTEGPTADELINYLTFKMKCAAKQEALKWKLDVDRAQGYLTDWEQQKEEKTEALAKAMPERILTAMRMQPKVMYKKDGSLSSHGERWIELCKTNRMPYTTKSMVVEVGREQGNPNSSDQVKMWLFDLGWQPRTYKFVREDDGSERKIPQIRKDGELCESVLELADKEPSITILDGLSVLTHRIGLLKGMLVSQRDGYVQATVAGFTNTLRFRHAKPLVNLPSVDRPLGKEIRSCLASPDGYVLCGADMTSLEDTTKRHYMKPHDPDYVAEMSKEGFDPHLDLAKHAGVVTQEDIDKHNSGERSLKALRKNYKVVNYSATYGVGAPKLARETGMSKKDAQKLLDAFWSRNWSIEKVSSELRVREVLGGMWVQNPVSKLWYSLRSDKDKFSTLNQGTGVWCFDNWVAQCQEFGLNIIGQFHDEIIALVDERYVESIKYRLEETIRKVNDKLKLNVELGIDAQFGKNYAEIH